MSKPILYALNDFSLTAELVDVDPGTGAETPVPSATAFLAETQDASAPFDPSLSATGVNTSGNDWLFVFDSTVLLPALLGTMDAHWAIIEGGGVRLEIHLEYQASRPGITPLEELKTHLRVRNTAEDAYIVQLYNSAIAAIEADTGEFYGPQKTVTETIYSNTDIAWLLSTPRSITLLEALDESSEWQTVTEYEQAGRRIKFTDTETWRWPPERRITYVTGYSFDEIPEHIRHRIYQLVTLWFENRLPTPQTLEVQAALMGPGGI